MLNVSIDLIAIIAISLNIVIDDRRFDVDTVNRSTGKLASPAQCI